MYGKANSLYFSYSIYLFLRLRLPGFFNTQQSYVLGET